MKTSLLTPDHKQRREVLQESAYRANNHELTLEYELKEAYTQGKAHLRIKHGTARNRLKSG